MLKDNFLKKILIVEYFIVCIFTIIFAIASIWDYSLLTGFLMGTFVCTIAFLINTFTAKQMLHYKGSKKIASTFGIIRIIIQLVWYVAWVFIVIGIDSAALGHAFGKGGTETLLKTINFITFMVGISVVSISIFVAHFITSFRRKGRV